METQIYEDIKTRTNGDIYIGVVGPVRVGKSTFITEFMKKLVIPNIENENAKKRTIDELPQSADGKTVMTTQPRFVPNEAVKIAVADKINLKVRMIDSVGYLVSGAMGVTENDKPRLVKTPWSKKEMPFEKAAELGTKKVIEDHSTIGIVVTTDGTVTDLDRGSYLKAEEEIIRDVKKCNKPFVIVLNTKIVEACECRGCHQSLSAAELPESVCSCINGRICCEPAGKILTVSLGFFSVVRIERPAQYLVHGTEYTVPEKECVSPTTDDPCKMFKHMAFPINEFYPPSLCDVKGSTDNDGCGCGRK